ncbi:hypothetical protein KV697_11235 [Sphingomonas sanguinis]|uniref:hypothetical protein n=1 Tax=Sphingomonas sanguinis TaxID=33051 RepID=UPI001C57BE93|nr:hypothetical protein [Sphingomonas sanguinis]QXT37982.1 hypothetical protein KV697_11235 [Sphingomonas sanguinis]
MIWRRYVEKAIIGVVRGSVWFNHRRLLEPIGNIPPAEAKEQYYAAANIIDMAA